jgi:hypothetical protein
MFSRLAVFSKERILASDIYPTGCRLVLNVIYETDEKKWFCSSKCDLMQYVKAFKQHNREHTRALNLEFSDVSHFTCSWAWTDELLLSSVNCMYVLNVDTHGYNLNMNRNQKAMGQKTITKPNKAKKDTEGNERLCKVKLTWCGTVTKPSKTPKTDSSAVDAINRSMRAMNLDEPVAVSNICGDGGIIVARHPLHLDTFNVSFLNNM